MLELQTFLVELIKNFEVAMPSDVIKIRREACLLVMVPTVEGELEKGTQLPLRVRLATRDEHL